MQSSFPSILAILQDYTVKLTCVDEINIGSGWYSLIPVVCKQYIYKNDVQNCDKQLQVLF